MAEISPSQKVVEKTRFHVKRLEGKSIVPSSLSNNEQRNIFQDSIESIQTPIDVRNNILALQKDEQLLTILTVPLQERFKNLQDKLINEIDETQIRHLIKEESGKDRIDNTRLVEQLLMRTVNLNLNEALFPQSIQQLALLQVLAADDSLP